MPTVKFFKCPSIVTVTGRPCAVLDNHQKFHFDTGIILMVKILSIVCSGTCGGSFTTAQGHMSSPSYPNYYPANEDCIYTISLPADTVILLNFISMDIQVRSSYYGNCLDYLEIRDGPSDDSPLLESLCGSEIPAPIQSSQNQLWMK